MEQRIINTTCGHQFVVIDEQRKVLKPHSTNRPAVIYPDGREEYYLNGIKYEKSVWQQIVKQNKKSYTEEI
jgi:hypothetical protein